MRLFGRRPICFALLWLAVVCGQAAFQPALGRGAEDESTDRSGSAAKSSNSDQIAGGDAATTTKQSHGGADKESATANAIVPIAKPPTVVEEPPIYYARDQQGRLVPLLGFSYEELLEFIRQKKSDPATAKPHGYSLEQLEISGNVDQDHANLIAKYKIRLDEAGTVNVPLIGGGAVLRQGADYQGTGQQSLEFNAASSWYTLSLHGTARSEHEITLKLLAPIKATVGQTRLEINLPTATASQLSLILPNTAGTIEVTDHVGIATAEAKSRDAGGQEITAWGLGGPVALAWKVGTTGAQAVLEATGQIRAAIDSRSVQFDTTLSVKSFGRMFDRFHIKLPPGAQLAGDAPAGSGYTLTSGGDPTSPLVEVQLAQKTAGPVQIKLKAERAYDVTQANSTLELAGFEIVEAAAHRQWGQIAVAIAGDWQPVWGQRNHVRQTAELPDELKRSDVVASFEYLSQPATLSVRLAPRRTRVTVEPGYIYYVDGQQIRLEARLKYNIRGAKTSSLDVAMTGWEIDDIGPVEIIDTDTSLANRSAEFSVPLLQPTSGELELVIHAHRMLAKNATRFEITLPQPVADVISPAVVAVSPADNIRIHPREEELQGLSRSAVPPRIKLPPQEQSPLFFHSEQPQATLICDLERLPQTITATVSSDLELRRDEIEIEQRFRYHVEHEAMTEVRLEVPTSILDSGHLELSLNDETLAQTSPNTPDSDSTNAQIHVELPEPQIGDFEIKARYRLPQTLDKFGEGLLSIPLAMPEEITPEKNWLTIGGEMVSRVQPSDDAWETSDEAISTAPENNGPALGLAALRATSAIQLLIRPQDALHRGTTTVERAWIQTWLSGGIRQERAAYRFTSTADEIELTLPPEATAANVELRLDQRLLAPPSTNDNGKIKLPISASGHPHVLELRYQVNDSATRGDTVTVDLPKLAGYVWLDRLYWQLILPRNEHLISASAELTPEFTWGWMGWGWARLPEWKQADLEKWVGASTSAPLPEATNRYLFSATGNRTQVTARFVARWEIVFLASALTLGVGLILINTTLTRRPSFLFATAVILLALAAWIPDAAVLLAQAAVLGILLLLIAVWLRRTIARRRVTAVVVPNRASTVMERSSAKTKFRQLELTAASTTAPAPQADLASEPAENE